MKNLLKIIAVAILLIIVTVSCKKEVNFSVVTPPETPEKGVVINGVKWATRNVDKPGTFVAKSENAGMLYKWNRKTGWSSTNPITNTNGGTKWDITEADGDTWEKENDPCPKGWRVPTREELQSLVATGSEWVTRNGIKGRIFGNDNNAVFFPAVGYRYSSNGTLESVGSEGVYWSATPNGSENAYYMTFGNMSARTDYDPHNNGFSVRCVAE